MSDKTLIEIAEAALAYVRPNGGLVAEKFDMLVNAVANYRAVRDPEAAKRNRDEHGPDIPTKNLDWRDKL